MLCLRFCADDSNSRNWVEAVTSLCRSRPYVARMSLAVQECSALSAFLARTTDNSAFYAARTAADGVSKINEMACLRGNPWYRLFRIDHRVETARENAFEIALVADVELSIAY